MPILLLYNKGGRIIKGKNIKNNIMGHNVTLGGERLGSGKKNKVYLHNYERSTHDLGYVWRSTMAPGTLVPFLTEVALPGDTMDISLNADVMTHPTIGPLFGSYKLQLDVFQVPIRLYQAALHMNMLNIGMDMSKITLPQLYLLADVPDASKPIDNQQINASSILSYLNIRGVGASTVNPGLQLHRYFNAIPFLGYWDIYKNYYANKQEEVGYVIHKNLHPTILALVSAHTSGTSPNNVNIPVNGGGGATTPVVVLKTSTVLIGITGGDGTQNPNNMQWIIQVPAGDLFVLKGGDVFKTWHQDINAQTWLGSDPTDILLNFINIQFNDISWNQAGELTDIYGQPNLVPFELAGIDTMRMLLLQQPITTQFIVDDGAPQPYNMLFESIPDPTDGDKAIYSKQFGLEGLGIKTYQSDLFNNWILTEFIDGADGISAITAVDTSGGSFTIDELNMSKKVYNMLNRIAVSGGTYDDWLDAVYTHERHRSAENPIYLGGLIKEVIFQEVVSTAQAGTDPLGTLAGKGRMGQKHKGGNVVVKIDEPSYIMGIVSLTPRIDYSQGNKWDTNLNTMNDFHKPALDEIGFQDLITDQMAWFDTHVDNTGPTPVIGYESAGKQPAWINYMTNVNQTRGNFADQNQQMFMTLNRRYEVEYDPTLRDTRIKDLTTYIDPVKFNFIFADTRRDAQNFWVQIAVNNTARRKMSAKVIPNL